MIEKFTSVKEVIAKVYRDLALEDENRWEDMIEWSAEALEQIGAFQQYTHKAVKLEVENYRLSIPCDLHKIVGITYQDIPLKTLSGNFDTINRESGQESLRSGSFHGYTVNNNYINFNFESGEVDFAYLCVPTDEEGFPLIPDNISYKEAIEKYIVMKLKYPDFLMEKIGQGTWDIIRNDWHWFCSQARGKANMPNADKLESIKNMWNRLKPMMNEHRHNFNKLNNSERITHN